VSGAGLWPGLFGDPQIAAALDDAAWLRAMLRFEAALAEAQAAEGMIPAEAAAAIVRGLDGLAPDPADLAAGAAEAGVPVPALLGWARPRLGDAGPWLHYGATSQDAMDTGAVLMLRDACDLFDARLARLTAVLGLAARAHAGTVMAARTRTQIAAPTTFGLRIAGWLGPIARARTRLAEIRPRLLLVQLGGGAGTAAAFGGRGAALAAHLGAALAAHLGAALGLGVPPKPWHAERDGIAEFCCWMALTAAACGRIGADLSLMARSEIAEVRVGAGGSSTLPHKSNPTPAEALPALARFTASLTPAACAAALHVEERDLSAWALEWRTIPPLAEATGAALRLAADCVEGMRVDPAAMRAHLDATRGAACAEAMAFARAPSVGLPAAQAAVKAALADMGPAETLAEALARRGAALDPAAFADPAAHVGEAAAMIEAALAAAEV
jgi:3-carboxy-cis,cis-muconate cycloisomerase